MTTHNKRFHTDISTYSYTHTINHYTQKHMLRTRNTCFIPDVLEKVNTTGDSAAKLHGGAHRGRAPQHS